MPENVPSLLEKLGLSKRTKSATDSRNRQAKNIAKHTRLANATKGHEREVHLKKIEELTKKYK